MFGGRLKNMENPKETKKENGLLKSGMPYKLMLMIENGDEKTIDEWAEEFNISPRDIQNTLTNLRKKGYLYYPNGGASGNFKGMGAKKGKIVKITSNKKYFLATMSQERLHHIGPHLTAFSRFLEIGVNKFPELRQEFLSYLMEETVKLSLTSKSLKE